MPKKNVLDTPADVVDCIIPRSKVSTPPKCAQSSHLRWPFPSDQRRWDKCTLLRTPGWILTFVVLNWQVWMCWSLLILGSSLLAERYGIRLRNESAAAKKHRNGVFSRRKNGVFSDAQADVVDHQKAQCKNITRKRKHDEKYIRENSLKKRLFWEFCFVPALPHPKKHNYFAQSRFPKYRCFFDVRGQKNGKNSTPSAMGETPWSKYVSAERKNVFRRNPQKKNFWGFFEIKTAQTWISQAIHNLEEIYLFY